MNILTKTNFFERAEKNLGTFNNHYLDQDSKEVFFAFSAINSNDSYSYPEITPIKSYCGEFLLNLCHADNNYQYHTTSGSAEAVFLGVLILKKNFQATYKNHGKLNLIIASNAHISWNKAASYLDLELKILPIDEKSLLLDLNKVQNAIDANTIGICATLGTPTTLLFDPVLALNTLLAEHYRATGHFISIHVDAASGGFVAPFYYPNLVWDFRLPHVTSINISSHKYGMVYPCLGWLLTRTLPCLAHLTHQNNYLGNIMQRISLQFSSCAAHLVTQYHHLRVQGKQGYQRRIMELFEVAAMLRQALRCLPEFEVLEWDNTPQLPGVVFKAGEGFCLTQFAADLQSKKGWCLPIYTLPIPHSTTQVARIVIRHGFTPLHIQRLISDIKLCVKESTSMNYNIGIL